MGKPEKNGQQKETSMVLDLSDFVKEVDRFSRLIEPFALVFYTIDDIRKWRFRNGTIVLWLICNIFCIWLTQAAAFVCASCVVIAVATLCLFQIHTRILDKVLPSSKLPVTKSEHESTDGALDTVQNFRYSLIEMHDFVIKCNEYLSHFYSILKWDSALPSLIYHTEMCIFVICLVMCPARWNCFLLVNWFFLCHPHILQKFYSYILRTWGQPKASVTEDQNEKSSIKEGKEDVTDGKDCDMAAEDSDDSDADYDFLGDESMIGLDPSPTKPGMVARLMEIKKRRKQISSAPAAMKETVLVCTSCHTLLVDQGDIAADKAVTLTQDNSQDQTTTVH